MTDVRCNQVLGERFVERKKLVYMEDEGSRTEWEWDGETDTNTIRRSRWFSRMKDRNLWSVLIVMVWMGWRDTPFKKI